MQFVVQEGGTRLDRLVAHQAAVSRRIARMWIASGRVQVNRRIMRILTRPIAAGAQVDVRAVQEATDVAAPVLAGDAAAVAILYIDKWIVVVNKPARLLSEADRFGSPSLQSVLPPLLAARGERQNKLWLVHRLDAGTSGVMILARTPMAAAHLGDTFRQVQAKKTYLALCLGHLRAARDIDAPIARLVRTRHHVHAAGKPARTRVEPVCYGPHACLVKALPRTGRTHQIRVHLSHLGHPLLGDRLYGGPGYAETVPVHSLARPMLHARCLKVRHPKHGEEMSFAAPLPVDFVEAAQTYALDVDGV